MFDRADQHGSIPQVFEQSDGPVFILDPAEDRIIDANAAACRMLEYTREELRATPISDVHPAELPQLEAFFEAARIAGANWTLAMTCRTKSGTFLPTEIALFVLDSGEHVYVIGLVRDRSEHRV